MLEALASDLTSNKCEIELTPPKTPSVTQAVSSAEDLPVPPPARHWEVAARANCYKGKGGEPIQPQDAPKWVDSIDACRAE